MDYYDFSFCQHVVNYYDVRFQAGLASMRQAKKRGLGVVATEPLMAGRLADRLPSEAQAVFESTGIRRSAAGWGLRRVWDQPEVSLLLSGMSTLQQVEEDIRPADEAAVPLN